MTRSSTLGTLIAVAAAAILTPLASADPVLTSSSDGVTATVDIVGANPNRNVWFLRLPNGIDHAILDDVWDTAAAGATLAYTGRTDAMGEYHLSFGASIAPSGVEYAVYTPFSGIRFLGTMLPNPVQSMVLQPGPGFTGPTPEPGRIGTGTAKAIARWDVVPYQTIREADTPTFKVGVVAFHIAVIDRVSMSVEGGPWTDVQEMTLNERTGVWEYTATIDASLFDADGPIELRAIAYPNAAAPPAEGTDGYPGGGDPRLLDSLFLYVDVDAPRVPNVAYCSPSGSDDSGDGSAANPYASPWRAAKRVEELGGGNADGGIVYMEAGDYAWIETRPWWDSIPVTNHEWLTFMPAPGVTRDQVQIVSASYPGMQIDHVRLYDITMRTFVHGDDGGGGGNDHLWSDHCSWIGAGPGTSVHFGGWTPGWKAKYWTDVVSSDNSASVPNGAALLRNVSCARNGYGLSYPGLVVNCTWDVMDSFGSGSHGAFLNWNFAGPEATFDNNIVYGVTARDCGLLGLFFSNTGHLTNVAIVNMALELTGSGGTAMGGGCLELEHFLMLNCTHKGIFRWAMPQAFMNNLSIRANHFGMMGIDPLGGTGGDSVDDGWFDQNSFGPAGLIPGTNVSTADPQFIDTFQPGPSSPLRDRQAPLLVPIDKDGVVRTAPATIGAVE